VQATTQTRNEVNANVRREVKRLTPLDYSNAGILKSYDWSVKEREAHDKIMEKYRQYLMKLCTLSHEITGLPNEESE
jgi:hypothetical protein